MKKRKSNAFSSLVGDENDIRDTLARLEISKPTPAPVQASHMLETVSEEKKQLSDPEIDAKFATLLLERGVTDEQDRKTLVKNVSKEKKLLFLTNHEQLVAPEDCQKFIDELATLAPSIEVLQDLQVTLRTFYSSSFLDEFIKKEGLDFLLSILTRHSHARKTLDDLEIQEQVILCLQAIIASEPGLKALLQITDSMNILVLALDFRVSQVKASKKQITMDAPKKRKSVFDSSTTEFEAPSFLLVDKKDEGQLQLNFLRSRVMFLLAIICHYSDEGYTSVLAAFDYYRHVRREKSRFQDWMNTLVHSTSLNPYVTSFCINVTLGIMLNRA